MLTASRVELSALVFLSLISHAQGQAVSAVGLEVPAPAAPREGHFLAGTYVSGSYAPVLSPGATGYAVQPYLRYVLGREGHFRPYVQYNFAPYGVRAYSSAAPLGGASSEVVANPTFAPLPLRYPAAGYGYGGLGSFSVGIPMQVGRGTAVLNVGGTLLSGLLGGGVR